VGSQLQWLATCFFLFWQIFDIFGIVQSGIGQLETAYKKIPFKLSWTHYSDV